MKVSTKVIDNDGDGVADGKVTKGADTADSLAADLAGNHNDTIDTADGDDVISAGNGADIIKGGAGSDYIFGGANTGKDNQGKAQKDVAVYDGRVTTDSSDKSNIKSADFTVSQKGYVLCLGVDSDICELTKLSTADDKAIAAETTQKVTSGTAFTLSSGAQDGSSLTGGKKITITSTGDDSGVKFTVKGKDINGNDLTEEITGAKAGKTVTTTKLFSKVIKISGDKDTANKVKAGFAEKAGSVTDNNITSSLSTQPDIFTSAEEKIALTVVKGYNVAGAGDADDTVEVAEAVDAAAKTTSGTLASAADSISAISTSSTVNSALSLEAGAAGSALTGGKLITIFSEKDDSSVDFTVVGKDKGGNDLTEIISGAKAGETVSTKNLFSKVVSITPSKETAGKVKAGADSVITLNGDCAKNGIVECKDPKKVKITSAADDSGIKFLVSGKDASGNVITEEISGSDTGTSFGTKDFKQIDSIAVKGGTAKAGVQVGLTQFYLDLDNDGMADLLKDNKIQIDTDGDGKIDIDVNKATDMAADKIFVLTDSNSKVHHVHEGMELKPVYEVASSDGKTKDTVIEVETLQFSDGNMELNPETTEKTSFDYTKLKMSTVKTFKGTDFADKIVAGTDIDIMEGGKWKDTFVFGSGTGNDKITDFVVSDVDGNDDKKIDSSKDTFKDVIHILKNVNGASIETAANVISRATQGSEGTVINLGGDGNTLTLVGVNKDDLTTDHIVVVDVL